jgi:eukaryotic-like serine/threonine-protein kinase
MTDVLKRLRDALSGHYAVERELGQGGMATVYLATDVKHRRRVAIKVLAPDISRSVGPDRFLREIEIAAGLTHPHILPVFDSGEADGLLYYVMPFIAGESLRERLRRERSLPLDDALRITREVASALDYAHRQGFVHRDIKPENILLEDGHAVVADFGVARALAVAGDHKLTGTGLAIGTPQYMSPEQSTGDTNVDGRSDLYALACVTYEMIAGHAVFEGASQVSVIKKHLTEPPRRLDRVRPEVPPAVATAVERALAKEAGDRFKTSAEFGAALGAAALTPPGGIFVGPRRRWFMGGAIAAGVLAVAATATLVLTRGAGALDPNLVAVAPFDVLAPGLELWREGLVDILSRNLDGAGPLRAVAPSLVVKRWSGRVEPGAVSELGRRLGARLTVHGRVVAAGRDSIRVTANLMDGMNSIAELELRDVGERMDRIADSITVALLRELGRTRPIGAVRLTSLGSKSLPALKAFLQGERWYRHTDWDSAIVYYRRAVELDSNFTLALRRIATALGWQRAGLDSLSRFLHLRAGALNHGLSPRDSLLVVADSLSAAMFLIVQDTLFYQHARRLLATVNQAVSRYPEDTEAWYAMGEARFHFGFAINAGATWDAALEAFDRAIALDSAFGPAYIHNVDLALRLGGAPLARRYINAYLALDPKDINAQGIRFVDRLLGPTGRDSTALERLVDSVAVQVLVHASGIAFWEDSAQTGLRVFKSAADSGKFPHAQVVALLALRGRLREAAALVPPPDAPPNWIGINRIVRGMMAATGMLGADSARAVLRELTTAPGPGADFAPAFWAANGDTTSLRNFGQVLTRAATQVGPFLRPLIRYTSASVEGYVALARRDTTTALARFAALPDSLCSFCWVPSLTRAQLLAARGRDREAAALLNRDVLAGNGDPRTTFWQLERGRVNERLGNRADALSAYRRVATMWRNADPELKPYADEAQAAVERLAREPGR